MSLKETRVDIMDWIDGWIGQVFMITKNTTFQNVRLCSNADPFAVSAFGPRFIADRGEKVTHFLCLHHFGWSHYRMLCISKFQQISRMSVCIVMCDIWDEQGYGETRCRHQHTPVEKHQRRPPGLSSTSNSTYAFTSYGLRWDL